MAARGKEARQRHQVRASLHDGMGALWDYVMSFPEGGRVHALIYVASLGADFRFATLQTAAAGIAVAPQARSLPPSPAAASAGSEVAAADRPRSLDPDGAGAATAGMVGWDFSDSFDAVAPMQ